MSALTITGLLFFGFMVILAVFAHAGRVHNEKIHKHKKIA